jgi:hypothetical protein
MAICKTDNSIKSIRGRFGGVYFKKDNAGQHIQVMPRSIRKASLESPMIAPESPELNRAAMRDAFSGAAWWWMLVIALAAITGWVLFAGEFTYGLDEDRQKKISGYNWFMHFNVIRNAKGKPPRIHPPNSPSDLPVAEATSGYNPLNYSNFYDAGMYNGKKLYKSQDGKWYTWWLDPSWVISNQPGQAEEPPYWFRLDESEFGDYIPVEPVYETSNFVSDD